LDNLLASPIDDGNETGTCGDHRFFCVYWAPSSLECRKFRPVEPNCENLREFFDTKGANRHRETSEKSLCILSLLLIDIQ
jgi:hypothetical protein